MCATQANGLVVAPDGVAEELLDALKARLRAPVLEWRCAGTPWDGEQQPITLVLHDVIAMRPRQQRSLFAWMNGHGDRSRVISFAHSRLFPLVEAGAFFDSLYYRLNCVYAEHAEGQSQTAGAMSGALQRTGRLAGASHARAEAAFDCRMDLLDRVRGEYLEMPGLSLTEPQAQRLWGLDGAVCRAVLDALAQAGFLRRTNRGGYVRDDVQS